MQLIFSLDILWPKVLPNLMIINTDNRMLLKLVIFNKKYTLIYFRRVFVDCNNVRKKTVLTALFYIISFLNSFKHI